MRDRKYLGFRALAIVLVIACNSVSAQTTTPDSAAPALEVISVKQNNVSDESGAFGARPDGIYAQNVPLRFLLNLAFNRQFGRSQIVGLPAWADVDHFDVQAKVSEADIPKLHGLSGGPLTAMRSELLRSVLSERFGLKTHVEVREGPVYALVIAKTGSKIKPASPDGKPEMPSPDGPFQRGSSLATSGKIAGHDVPFNRLIEALLSDGHLDRVVIDRTGLTGNYDYFLKWVPDQLARDGNNAQADDNNLPSLFTALQEQLGLKLEASKGSIRTLVIDHVEKPSGN